MTVGSTGIGVVVGTSTTGVFVGISTTAVAVAGSTVSVGIGSVGSGCAVGANPSRLAYLDYCPRFRYAARSAWAEVWVGGFTGSITPIVA